MHLTERRQLDETMLPDSRPASTTVESPAVEGVLSLEREPLVPIVSVRIPEPAVPVGVEIRPTESLRMVVEEKVAAVVHAELQKPATPLTPVHHGLESLREPSPVEHDYDAFDHDVHEEESLHEAHRSAAPAHRRRIKKQPSKQFPTADILPDGFGGRVKARVGHVWCHGVF